MKLNKKQIIIGASVLVFLFVWFYIRPSMIRRYCVGKAFDRRTATQAEMSYRACLAKYGLKPEQLYIDVD